MPNLLRGFQTNLFQSMMSIKFIDSLIRCLFSKTGSKKPGRKTGVTQEGRRTANSLFKEVPKEQDIHAVPEAPVVEGELVSENNAVPDNDEVPEEYAEDVVEDAVVEEVEAGDAISSVDEDASLEETSEELADVDDLTVSIEDIYPQREVFHGDFASAVKELISDIDEEDLPLFRGHRIGCLSPGVG